MCEANNSIISTYRYIGSSVIGTLSIFAILTPILMILLPKMDVVGFKESQMICNVECDGLLISFSFKLVILTIGTWALFFRPSKVMKYDRNDYVRHTYRVIFDMISLLIYRSTFQATLPRIYMFRSCICVLLFVIVFAFWLFYGVRVLDGRGGEGQAMISAAHRKVQYIDVVNYASNMVDSLLFVYYLAIVLIELRHSSNTQ